MMDWFSHFMKLQPVPQKEPPEISALLDQLDRQRETAIATTEQAKRISGIEHALITIAKDTGQ